MAEIDQLREALKTLPIRIDERPDPEVIGELAAQIYNDDIKPWLIKRMNTKAGQKYPTPPVAATRPLGRLLMVCRSYHVAPPLKLPLAIETVLDPLTKLPTSPEPHRSTKYRRTQRM